VAACSTGNGSPKRRGNSDLRPLGRPGGPRTPAEEKRIAELREQGQRLVAEEARGSPGDIDASDLPDLETEGGEGET